ncbi:hypothetical protein TNCV_1246931 [Trichonephila clavipes]|uniref:Uncharacterized protein n=1 Tax=Trichonephila clavipes TaxID=2585209 RepID=A0A8X6V1J1_TRICX|nr:hypothetical protein TNCV_1246931 [Trichonephila clavipes]
MITLVLRLLLAYIDTTATHSPTSESVDRRTNIIVVMASVGVFAAASSVFDGFLIASRVSDGFVVASSVYDSFLVASSVSDALAVASSVSNGFLVASSVSDGFFAASSVSYSLVVVCVREIRRLVCSVMWI